MRMAKIDYLNLMPFYIFAKKNGVIFRHCRFDGCPSKVNVAFAKNQVDFAFLSSIEARKYRTLNVGVVAKKKVKSVFVVPGIHQDDLRSATSNILAKILEVQGQVVIGDKALKMWYDAQKNTTTKVALKNISNQNCFEKNIVSQNDPYIDLAKVWWQKNHLSFVFAQLCWHKKCPKLKRLAQKFAQKKLFIPYSQLKKRALKMGITACEARDYLSIISYKIEKKEQKSLRLFYRKAKEKRLI